LVPGLFIPLCALVLAVDMIIAVATDRIHSIQASGGLIERVSSLRREKGSCRTVVHRRGSSAPSRTGHV